MKVTKYFLSVCFLLNSIVATAGNDSDYYCKKEVHEDSIFRMQYLATSSTAIKQMHIDPVVECFTEKEDRMFNCSFGAYVTGVTIFFAHVVPWTLPLYFGGIYLIDSEERNAIKEMKAQVEINKAIDDFYGENGGSKKLDYFSKRVADFEISDEELTEVLLELKDSSDLCSNPMQSEKSLKVNAEGKEILKQRGLVPMDLIFSRDELGEEFINWFVSNYLYIDYVYYGQVISPQQFSEMMDKILVGKGYQKKKHDEEMGFQH